MLDIILSDLGQPTSLQQDNRAGIAAIWGSRATGGFYVERGPIDTKYDIGLIPVEGSKYMFEKHTFSADELNTWYAQNRSKIIDILGGS